MFASRRFPWLPSLLILAWIGCSLPSDEVMHETEHFGLEISQVEITPDAANPEMYVADVEWSATGSVRAVEWQLERWSPAGASTVSEWSAADRAGAVLTGLDSGTFILSVRALPENQGEAIVRRIAVAKGRAVPAARIVFPQFGAFPQFPPTIPFRWDAFDTHGSLGLPSTPPSGFEYKLVEVPQFASDARVVDELLYGDNLLLEEGDDSWIRVPASSRERLLEDLTVRSSLAFGVRAIDENGNPEPLLERGRNFLTWTVTDVPFLPEVTLIEPANGEHLFPFDGDVWNVAVAPNVPVRFRWVVTSEVHPAPFLANTNYALDVPNPDDESQASPDGRGGWIGWKKRSALDTPFVFTSQEAGTTHVFYLKVRDVLDDPEVFRLVVVNIDVLDLPMDKFALIVDDAKFTTYPPQDADHDQFIDDVVAARLFELGEVDHIAVYPPQGGTPERSQPLEIPLEVLGRYQVIVWHTNAFGGNADVGLWLHEESLRRYSQGGGRLFFTGGTISSFFLNPLGDFYYPKAPPFATGPDYTEGSFIWRFLKYRNEIVSVPTDGSAIEKQASGMVGAVPVEPGYPAIGLDLSKIDPYEIVDGGTSFRGGIGTWEGVLGTYAPVQKMAGLDTLYTVQTFDTTFCCGSYSPEFEDAVVAQRYESTFADTLAGEHQGNLVIFNFQSWWFEPGPLRQACRDAIDWLVRGL